MYYGWVILAVCSVAAIASAPGQTFLLGMLNTPLREATGLGATALSGAYLVATGASALSMTFVGRLSDRIGPRWVIALAALGLGLMGQLVGSVQGLLTLTVVFFGFRFFGQGALMLGSAHLLAMWFDRRLGTAEGIRGAVMSLGFAALPPIFAALIARHGWTTASAWLGVGVWIAVLPLAVLVARDSPEHVGTTIDGGPGPGGAAEPDPGYTLADTMRSAAFWPVVAQIVAGVLVVTAIMFHLQPLLASVGLPAEVAALALTANPLASGVATFAGGWLADRAPMQRLLLAGGLVSGAATALLALVGTAGAAVGALGLLGVGQGLAMTAGTTAIARWYGRAHHGAIRGFTTTAMVAGTSAGPLLLSASRDLLGSWRPGLLAAAALLAALGVACAFVRRPDPAHR